jgi:hypothetical protein
MLSSSSSFSMLLLLLLLLLLLFFSSFCSFFWWVPGQLVDFSTLFFLSLFFFFFFLPFAYVHRPGFTTRPVETDMDLSYSDKFPDVQLPDAYARLLLDVLRGEQATFVRSDELDAAWAIFTPLLHRIESEKIKPFDYPFGGRGPEQADQMVSQYYERSKEYVWKGRDYGSSFDESMASRM